MGRSSSYPNAAGAALLQAAELAAERRAAQLASSNAPHGREQRVMLMMSPGGRAALP